MLYHATEEGQELTLNTQTRQLLHHPSSLSLGRIVELTRPNGVAQWKTRLTENPTGWQGVPTYSDGTSAYATEEEYWDMLTKDVFHADRGVAHAHLREPVIEEA